MTYHKGEFVYLFKKNNKIYLKLNNENILVENGIFSIDSLEDKLYLFGNKAYIYNESESFLEEEFPVVSKKIIENKNYKIKFFGGIKFSGNDEWTDIQGIYTLKYNNDVIKINSGDIIKAEINIDSNIKNYLTLESFIPSNSQLLDNYQERKITDSGKYYNYWYSEWNYTYTSYEFRKNKITFFNDYYNSGSYNYYFKLLSAGKYFIKPDFGYNMYLPNSYGLNERMILKVE
jgi:hypothetical protein